MKKTNHLQFLTCIPPLLLTSFLLLTGTVLSQDKHKADSLIRHLNANGTMTDSLRLEVLGGIFMNHTDQDIRLKYAQEALSIAERTEDGLWLLRSTLNIGHVHKLKGDLPEALTAYHTSWEHARDLDHKSGEAAALSAIGDVYAAEGSLQTAFNYYNRGIAALRVIRDSVNLGITLMNVGETYRMNQVPDTALLYFEESGKIFDLLDYGIGKAYYLGNIGLMYAEQGRHELAEAYVVDATRQLQALGDEYAVSVYYTFMADIYREKEEPERALDYATQAHEMALANGLKEQIRDASLKLSELYEASGAYEAAYHYQTQYITYRDSINSEEVTREIANLRTDYEVSQKQAEVDLLNQERKTYLAVGTGLAGLVLFIGYLAFVLNKHNREKRRTNRELEEVNATKDRLFTIIAHDLKSPVVALRRSQQKLAEAIGEKDEEEIATLVSNNKSVTDRTYQLLNNLLQWAMDQTDKLIFTKEPVRVSRLIEQVVYDYKGVIDTQGVLLNLDISVSSTLLGDLNSLKTVLRNVLDNAVKFTMEGGAITIRSTVEQDQVLISISDTGCGMDRDRLNGLFQENGHALPKKGSGTGTGLGLMLCKNFTEKNGGKLWVESKEGEGTTVTIALPSAPLSK